MRTLLPALTTLLTLVLFVVALVLNAAPRVPEGSTPVVVVEPHELG